MNNSSGVEAVMSYESYLATGIYVAVLGILASVGNLIVILVICGNRKRINFTKKQHVPLLLNLAVADIGVSIFGYPFTSMSGIAGRWLFEDAVCTMSAFGCFLLSMVSLDTLVAISVYRYIVICKPAWKTRLTPRTTVFVILATWGYAILWASVPLFGPAAYTYEPFGTSCSIGWRRRRTEDVTFIVLVDIMCFITHLFIMMICYIKLVLIQVGSFVCVWTPYAIVCSWYVLYDLPLWATTLPTMLAKLSCVLNPLIYSLFNKTFRRMSRDILCKCLLKKVGQSAAKYQPDAWYRPRQTVIDIFCVSPRTETTANCATVIELQPLKTGGEGTALAAGKLAPLRQKASVGRFTVQKADINSLFSAGVEKSNHQEQPIRDDFDNRQDCGSFGFSSTHRSPITYSVRQQSIFHTFNSENVLLQINVDDFRKNTLSWSNNMCRAVWEDIRTSTSN